MFSVMICQDTGWLEPSYKRLLIITFLKVYGENEWGKRFLEPDRSAHLPALLRRLRGSNRQTDQKEERSKEDLVSLAQAKELLQQQRNMLNALLQQQPESFKGFVKLFGFHQL